jgi:tRNA U34 5-methylaminomethyl-2-thiouridine-forming methyltransferase MnmC
LSLFQNKPISILEIGFGTGLNAFITLEGTKMNQSIDYVGVEAIRFAEELVSMNYVEELNALNHKGVLIKCIKVMGEKRESRR